MLVVACAAALVMVSQKAVATLPGQSQLTNSTVHDTVPSYSPDGTKIVYAGYDGNDREIYTISVGGEELGPRTTSTTPQKLPPGYPWTWGRRPVRQHRRPASSRGHRCVGVERRKVGWKNNEEGQQRRS
jgi:hypothetical protein